MSPLRRKTKEYPRKRKRFVKKVMLLTMVLFVITLVSSGVAYYIFEVKLKKPLYISPLPTMQQMAHAQENDKTYDLLQKDLKKQQIDYTNIDRGDNSYTITLQEGGKVTFSSQKDIMGQIASLQYILSHLKMEGREFSSLDLRFDKPVIVIK
jgi:hypothetical protein